MSMRLWSPSFKGGGYIPREYTCDGSDLSPPLRWSDLPKQAKGLALICEDPDAPGETWDHWILFNIPIGTEGIEGGVPRVPRLGNGSTHGANSWGRADYGGPCPPRGKPHRYIFRLYAVSKLLDSPPKTSKKDLLKALNDCVLDECQFMGIYGR
jgi:Raf kinase inhibitor-like YbhB/YbcL family protein